MTTVVVVASGPSFSEDQARLIRKARDAEKCRVIVVNRSWERVPNADVLYAADQKWWRRYWPEVETGFQGECWTCNKALADELGLCWIKTQPGTGLSRDPANLLHEGANSGYQAIGLAYKFLEFGLPYNVGAKRIVLVGFDMQFAGGSKTGRRHWHDDYESGVTVDAKGKTREQKWSNAAGVADWVPYFTPLASDLIRAGVECLNASEQSALQCFPRVRLDDVL